MAAASLPPANSKHWLPQHKAQVVAAVSAGVLNLHEACSRYALTEEEFAAWEAGIGRAGVSGLTSKKMQERRRAARRQLQEPAVAVLSSEVGIECVITDISAKGARLALKTVAPFPQVFELRCSRSGRSLRVYLVWQSDRTIGVSFDTASASAIEAGIDTWLLGERA